MLRNKILAFSALLLVPCLAHAQNLANDAGPFEITGSASGSNNREFSAGGFTVGGSVGFFVLPWLEIAARDGFTYNDAGGNTAFDWQNNVRGAIDFNLPLDHFEPFVGGSIGYFSSRHDGSSPEAAPELGLKFLFTKNVFLFGQIEYDFFWRNTGNTFSNGQFVYTVGLGVRF
jgi:hypothetical protein